MRLKSHFHRIIVILIISVIRANAQDTLEIPANV